MVITARLSMFILFLLSVTGCTDPLAVERNSTLHFQCVDEMDGLGPSSIDELCKEGCEPLTMTWYTLSDRSFEFVQIDAPALDGKTTLPRDQDQMVNEAIGRLKNRSYVIEGGSAMAGRVTTLKLEKRVSDSAFQVGQETSPIYEYCLLKETT